MRLYTHRLPDVELAAVRAVAARTGALVESPDTLRAGLGEVLFETSVAHPAVSAGEPFGFAWDLERDASAPPGVEQLAFASQPFSPSEPTVVRLYEHTVVERDRCVWVVSVNSDGDAVADEIQADSVPGPPDAYVVRDLTYESTPSGYASSVAAATAQIRAGELDKVVLARRVRGLADRAIDATSVLDRLRAREPTCTLFAFPSGDDWRYVGASPELLVALIDGAVSAHPLAGSASLSGTAESLALGSAALANAKNREEHAIVVQEIEARLATRCRDVRADAQPSVVAFNSVAHLGSWIYAKTDAESPVNALDLLELLHPTPAVGGRPTTRAIELITALEPAPRGLYAGAVGWLDHAGNGEWWIAIRGVEVRGDSFRAWGGAGIVADSDPWAETNETADKLTRLLYGLGDPLRETEPR